MAVASALIAIHRPPPVRRKQKNTPLLLLPRPQPQKGEAPPPPPPPPPEKSTSLDGPHAHSVDIPRRGRFHRLFRYRWVIIVCPFCASRGERSASLPWLRRPSAALIAIRVRLGSLGHSASDRLQLRGQSDRGFAGRLTIASAGSWVDTLIAESERLLRLPLTRLVEAGHCHM